MDQNTLYKQEILDHYKNPRNFGKLGNPTKTSKIVNSSCGDEIELFMEIDENGTIKDIKFDGSGCAISIASASILIQKLIGKNINEIQFITSDEVLKNIGMTKESGRVKCALIGWEAVNACLKD